MTVLSLCKWCGNSLNSGYKQCADCGKHQSWFHTIFAEGSNLIAVSAAIITFAQLMVTIDQNNQAVDAAGIANEAKNDAQTTLEQVEKMSIQLRARELEAEQLASQVNQALLKLEALESNAETQRQANLINQSISESRQKYDLIESQLQNTPKTLTEQTPVTAMEKQCHKILGLTKTCINVPIVKTVNKDVPNQDYLELQQQLSLMQREINSKEEDLRKVIQNGQPAY